jgi:uncharacterized SAM-dependent methyltransferase
MLPNFEPELILPRLAALLGPADFLLLSANLAPGPAYETGVQRVLPLYDNALTRDWLLTFLLDLGFDRDDGELRFQIERGSTGLQRIVAYFHCTRERRISVANETIAFHVGEAIRLFFSYRHTPGLVRELLGNHRVKVLGEWITKSGEEGVFLCQKTR